MIGTILIKETGATPKLTRRAHGDIMRRVLTEVAGTHHVKYMAKHFTGEGAREYGYQKRAGEGTSGKQFARSYTGRKNRQKGHMRPLVWSGASEILAKIRDVRATKHRATLVQHARGLNRRNPRSQINMAAEIRTVSERELQQALRLAGVLTRREYRAIRSTQTTRV